MWYLRIYRSLAGKRAGFKTNDGQIVEINKIKKTIQKIIPLKQDIQNIINVNTIKHKQYVILFQNTLGILKY